MYRKNRINNRSRVQTEHWDKSTGFVFPALLMFVMEQEKNIFAQDGPLIKICFCKLCLMSWAVHYMNLKLGTKNQIEKLNYKKIHFTFMQII